MDAQVKSKLLPYSPVELEELYKKDPDQFDALAGEAIRQACTGRTEEQTLRLRQMQWAIDGQLRKAKTPLQRMQIMENIFYEKVYGADGQLVKLVSAFFELVRVIGKMEVLEKKPQIQTSTHQVLPFKRTTS